jgi:hypothetical protein
VEMKLLWGRLRALGVAEAAQPSQDPQAILDLALRIAFYWYNMMPLSRGTAAIGLMSIHGIMLSFGWEILASVPKGYQCDWEAILTPDPADFCRSLSSWMLPACQRTNLVSTLPRVDTQVCPTVRQAIEFLNCSELREPERE